MKTYCRTDRPTHDPSAQPAADRRNRARFHTVIAGVVIRTHFATIIESVLCMKYQYIYIYMLTYGTYLRIECTE